MNDNKLRTMNIIVSGIINSLLSSTVIVREGQIDYSALKYKVDESVINSRITEMLGECYNIMEGTEDEEALREMTRCLNVLDSILNIDTSSEESTSARGASVS